MSKSIFRSRTFWFNVLAILGVLAALIADPRLGLDPRAVAIGLAGVNLVNILLRMGTDQPVHVVPPATPGIAKVPGDESES